MKAANRIETLPPYLFAEIDKRKAELRAQGIDLIAVDIGDPDMPTPAHVVEALREAALDPSTHQYPSYTGMPLLRSTIGDWFEGRFGVSLDPNTEVLPTWGSKEGIAHLPWCLIDRGDTALCSDPGYPVYGVGTALAGGEPVLVPCTAERDFVPDLSTIDPAVADRAKVLWLNFPGNPTGATVDLGFFEEAVAFCKRHDLVLAHDAAYSEVTFDGYRAPSVLEVPGAKDVAVEFHSFSKTFNMTGWRIGWVCGSSEVVEALGRLKTNLDSGVFNAIQRAAIAGLTGPMDFLREQNEIIAGRRDRAVKTLREIGLNAPSPRGSFYLWTPVPEGETSAGFATRVLHDAHVVITPGSGYGPNGEGYVRFSLTYPDSHIDEALERIRKIG